MCGCKARPVWLRCLLFSLCDERTSLLVPFIHHGSWCTDKHLAGARPVLAERASRSQVCASRRGAPSPGDLGSCSPGLPVPRLSSFRSSGFSVFFLKGSAQLIFTICHSLINLVSLQSSQNRDCFWKDSYCSGRESGVAVTPQSSICLALPASVFDL